MKKLKVLSLFNGMNCIGMALKSLNIEAELYCSEIDKYANKISSLLFPEAVNLGCVKTVKVEDIGKIELLVAGSPCQGFSFAGKQLNFEDERSKLFFEFIRILEEARKLNPEVKFLLENVKMSKEHQAVISRFCGIDPIEINSALLSAQNRRRLYWTNIGTNKNNLFGIEQPGIKQPADKGILLKDILEETAAEKYFDFEKNFLTIENIKKINSLSKNGILKIDKYFNIKDLQNKAGALNGGANSGGNHSDMDCLIIPEATKKGYTEIEEGECFDMLHPNSKTRRGRKMKDKSNCLTIVQPEFYRYQKARIRRFTPLECCRLQTIPEAETEKILNSGVSDSQIYKMLGNGWTVDVIAYILKHL
jgi:DNA (cytosine-5)-methyltransferase 3A